MSTARRYGTLSTVPELVCIADARGAVGDHRGAGGLDTVRGLGEITGCAGRIRSWPVLTSRLRGFRQIPAKWKRGYSTPLASYCSRMSATTRLSGSTRRDDATKSLVVRAVNDAVYGLMMVVDGVSGSLRNDEDAVDLTMTVRLRRGGTVITEMDLQQGDGMCMGYHGWIAGEFGTQPPAATRT